MDDDTAKQTPEKNAGQAGGPEDAASQAAANDDIAPANDVPAQDAQAGDDLLAENADLKDRLLRAMADMENLRRRTEREKQNASNYAITGFAKDVLAIGDNLARAMESLGDRSKAAADEAVKPLIEGVEMTRRELVNVLERHGVTKLEPLGGKFDPNLHQAMFEVPDPSVPSGTVTEIIQDGYAIKDRVLRPAMVGIAKGGPKEPANTDQSADDAGDAKSATAEKVGKTPPGEKAAQKTKQGAKDPGDLGKKIDKSA